MLKWILYLLLAATGIGAAVAALSLVAYVGIFVGIAALGITILWFVAALIKSIFEGPKEEGPMDRDG